MQPHTKGKLHIKVAVYGLKIVTNNIIALIKDGTPETLNFLVTTSTVGKDGWVGQEKSITIVYSYDDGPILIAAAREGEILSIGEKEFMNLNSATQQIEIFENSLSVLGATYGPDDVTPQVKEMVSSRKTLSFYINNTVFNDSWIGVEKTFIIILGVGKYVALAEIFIEREQCRIDLKNVALKNYTVMVA